MKVLSTNNYKKIKESAAGGRFKYKCDDCKEITYLSAQDRTRAAIPRCRSCGSSRLDPVSEYSKGQLGLAEQRRQEQKGRRY